MPDGGRKQEVCVLASADVNAMYKRLSPCLHTHVRGGQKGGTIQCPPVEWVERVVRCVLFSTKGKTLTPATTPLNLTALFPDKQAG